MKTIAITAAVALAVLTAGCKDDDKPPHTQPVPTGITYGWGSDNIVSGHSPGSHPVGQNPLTLPYEGGSNE